MRDEQNHAPQPVANSTEGSTVVPDRPPTRFEGTPEEIERQWFEQVYTGRGDRDPQLTTRAVLMGECWGCSCRSPTCTPR
jgi:hypothetical protein